MLRTAIAFAACITATCSPIRSAPDLTPAELLRHADSLVGREVVVRLSPHCWEADANGDVIVCTGKPNSLPVVVFCIDGAFSAKSDAGLVLVGVVARVDRDGIDRGFGRDGTLCRHCVTVTGCRPRVAVGF